LCEAKANPNYVPPDGAPPLVLAVSQGHADVVQELCQSYGTELRQTITAAKNCTALYLACQEGREDIVRHLLNHSAEAIDMPKLGGATPLYIASHDGHGECVSHLLEAKATVCGEAHMRECPSAM